MLLGDAGKNGGEEFTEYRTATVQQIKEEIIRDLSDDKDVWLGQFQSQHNLREEEGRENAGIGWNH